MTTKTITTTMDFRQVFADLNLNIVLNEVTREVEINGEALENFRISQYLCNLHDRGVNNESLVMNQIRFAALENKYHPIKQYLNSLAYDGHDYIGELCSYFQADQYFEVWLRRWLIMAIARVVACAQCPVLVLDGPQNCGKSKFVQWLCSSPKVKAYYTEGQIAPDSKDSRIRATQKWIWEVPEFGATARRADVESLKGFITLSEVTERAPYQKQDEKRPMLACFIGTINNGAAGFLTDKSGNRRFLITHIEHIDWKEYTANLSPDNIWAQAYADYLTGEPFELTENEIKLSSQNNETYQEPDALLTILESLYRIDLSSNSFVPASELIKELQDAGYKAGTTDALSKKLSSSLVGLGIPKIKRRANNLLGSNPVWGYAGLIKIP